MEALVNQKKVINFIKGNTKVSSNLHRNGDNSYLFVDRIEIFKFKAENKNINFPTQFCLKSMSNYLVLTNLENYL